MQIASSHRR